MRSLSTRRNAENILSEPCRSSLPLLQYLHITYREAFYENIYRIFFYFSFYILGGYSTTDILCLLKNAALVSYKIKEV